MHQKNNKHPLKIAIGINASKWHEKFMVSCEKLIDPAFAHAEFFHIDHHNWADKILEYDAVIWKPHYMGIEASSYFKEKIYFVEKHLNKLIMPNFETIWHFESKAAQSYIFNNKNVNTPQTFVSFDLIDSLHQIKSQVFPIVLKHPSGAGAVNVSLVDSADKMRAVLKNLFVQQRQKHASIENGKWLSKLSPRFLFSWFQASVLKTNQRCAYWQEFIPKNSRDLRITAIGDRFAFAFWRNNRPNDFRASGSGNIDYVSSIPIDAVRWCLDFNKEMGFDSMAYDLVYAEDGSFRVIEMSYGYKDKAIYDAHGHYELHGEKLDWFEGHCWPQELWVRWLLIVMENRLGVSCHVA